MKDITLEYALLEINKGSLKIQVFTKDLLKEAIQPDRSRSWLVKNLRVVRNEEDQNIKITGTKVDLVVSTLIIGNHYYFSPSQYQLMNDESKASVHKFGPLVFSDDPVQVTSNESSFNRIYFNYPIEIVPTNEACNDDACSLAEIVGSRRFKNEEINKESEQSGFKS